MEEIVKFAGKFRVYFNRSEDDPLIWSVDNGDIQTEICVADIAINVPVETRYKAGKLQPKAWFEGVGVVTVDRLNVARIRFIELTGPEGPGNNNK